jgi:arylformamidase
MTTPDAAWLDRQYNNRARIPEHPEIFARWERASALAREKSTCQLDMPYGKGRDEALDLFLPLRADAPILVFIHGGYWRALDKRDVSFVCPSFVQAGAMVVVPNYSLCPAVTIDEIALQMVRALAWVYRNAPAYGADRDQIVVAGHSAGGHLATMLLSCLWSEVDRDLPAGLVRAAMSISGLYDLEPLSHTPFLMDDLRLTSEAVQRLSPAGFAPPQGILYAAVGADESEEFLRQNQLIQDAWGVPVVPVCTAIPGTNHLNVLHDFADPAGHLHKLTLRLLGLPQSAAG